MINVIVVMQEMRGDQRDSDDAGDWSDAGDFVTSLQFVFLKRAINNNDNAPLRCQKLWSEQNWMCKLSARE